MSSTNKASRNSRPNAFSEQHFFAQLAERQRRFACCKRSRYQIGLALVIAFAFGTSPSRAEDATQSASEPAATDPELNDDPRKACIQDHKNAQLARRAGKLLEAAGHLRHCSRESCPNIIRVDCLAWHSEVTASLPSIVVSATSPHGDEVDVKVSMDGTVILDKLDGKPVEIDPGVHEFRFESRDFPLVEQRTLIRAGEKNRIIAVKFEAPAPETRVEPVPKVSAPPRPMHRPIPTLSYVLSGVSLLGATSFGYFAMRGLTTRSELEECQPLCDSDRVSASRRHLIVADVSLTVSVLAAAAAVTLYVTRPWVEDESRAAPNKSSPGPQPSKAQTHDELHIHGSTRSLGLAWRREF